MIWSNWNTTYYQPKLLTFTLNGLSRIFPLPTTHFWYNSLLLPPPHWIQTSSLMIYTGWVFWNSSTHCLPDILLTFPFFLVPQMTSSQLSCLLSIWSGRHTQSNTPSFHSAHVSAFLTATPSLILSELCIGELVRVKVLFLSILFQTHTLHSEIIAVYLCAEPHMWMTYPRKTTTRFQKPR